VGWSRIASGAHFLSDVLWSAALVNVVNFLVLIPFLVGGKWNHRPRRTASMAAVPGEPMEATS
jgi:membrane-associated phospholipid phosphatase